MYSIEDVKTIILRITDQIQDISEELTEIDSKLGDGDMGITMKKGAVAIRGICSSYTGFSIKDLFIQCAFALNKAAPSTMGTLISGSLIAIAKYCADNEKITDEDIIGIVNVMTEAISVRGRAKVGDKTILDSMIPYSRTLSIVWKEEKNLQNAHRKALKSAITGLESTKGMIAKTGRASWLGARNSDFPDAGAVMFCKIAGIFC